ncbi:MAG: uroporphyrinogen decarboxylase, partial [Aquificae bacterium]|nr:uroporphyrinogen decarboxylase [Aquificota bacterium]
MAESSLFLRALRGEPVERFPVWLMRQAGRYMPEYRALRSKVKNFWELCSTVELAVEVTLLPERLLGVDALILFSDILVPLKALGFGVRFEEGKGPLLEVPPPSEWRRFDPSEVSFVFETVKGVKKRSSLPLIGFGGAPFTLAAYAFEGKTSREFKEVRKVLHGNPKLFDLVMEKLTEMSVEYLSEQVKAGADALQLFDSWAFVLSPEAFGRYSRWLRELALELKRRHPETPVIYFFRGSGHLYRKAFELPFDAFSIDWTLDLETALRAVGGAALQGNLDPALLFAPEEVLKEETLKVLEAAARKRKTKFVFNLGHGIWPETDPAKVRFLVEVVKG